MARRRYTQKGTIESRDNAYWLRYSRDEIREDGTTHRARPRQFLGYIKGKDRITPSEAERRAREFLTEVDRPDAKPTSMMTLRSFWLGEYQPYLKANTSLNHQLAVASSMKMHILPALGDLQLREIARKHVQTLITALTEIKGLSPSTVRHARAYISGLLSHARLEKLISGDPVTTKLKMPRKKSKRPTLSLEFDQAGWVLSRLPQPYLTMVALSLCTSAGIAEMGGLKLRRLNLSKNILMVEDKFLPPNSMCVTENWSHVIIDGKRRKGHRETKTEFRDRVLPIPDAIVPLLEEVLAESRFTKPDDPVFASRAGSPVNDNNANKRLFGPLGEAMGVHFTWNSFRHTFATRSEDIAIRQFDKKAFMGHSLDSDITNGYTGKSWQRMQEIANTLAREFGIEELVKQRKGEIACLKVISIR